MDGATTARTPLNGAELRERLTGGSAPRWNRVDVVEQTGSTNADLLAAAADLPDRTVLIAEHQSRGRGRHNRAFSAPPRSQVAVSTLVDCAGAPPASLGWLPLLTGIVVTDVVRAAGVAARLKWPNDVLVDGRKIAGILVEVAPGGRVVIGVGLNVQMTADELPVPTATSLAVLGADVDRTVIALDYLTRLADRLDNWREGGWSVTEIGRDYRALCSTLGLRVRVELPGGTDLTGTAVDIDHFGRLIVHDAAGTSTAVSAGDVTHVRPA